MTSKLFMAFATGKESSEGAEFKLYTGVGSVYVLGVNPNKEELEKIYGRDIENAPIYVSEQEVDGNKIQNVRIDFIIKTDPTKNNDIENISKYSLFLRNEYRYNRDKTKVQVIDKYGRTCWVTIEQAKKKEIPMYSNGPANIDAGYRPAYVGEENLIKFLIAYLNIPNVMRYVNGSWDMVNNPEDSEAGLEKIKDYFKGDFSELKSIIALQPNNKVKVAFGVRTTDDNRQFQAFYTDMPMKNGISDYNRLGKDIESRKEAGAYPNTEFTIAPLSEYVNTPTNLSEDKPVDNPFNPVTDTEESPWF